MVLLGGTAAAMRANLMVRLAANDREEHQEESHEEG